MYTLLAAPVEAEGAPRAAVEQDLSAQLQQHATGLGLGYSNAGAPMKRKERRGRR